MRKLLQVGLAALVMISALGLGHAADKRAVPIPRPRPKLVPGQNGARPLAVQRLDPALVPILRDWHLASSKIERFDAKFSYVNYDTSFEVETVGEGVFSIDREGQVIYRLAPINTSPGQRGSRYPLKSARSESWYCVADRILRVNEREKSYEEMRIPQEDRGVVLRPRNPQRPAPPPLPEDVETEDGVELLVQLDRPPPPSLPEDANSSFWLEIFAVRILQIPSIYPTVKRFIMDPVPADLTNRYQISLLKESDRDWTLKFVPLLEADRATYREVRLMLTRQDHRVRAIKFVGPGPSDTVYVLSDIRINELPRPPFSELTIPDLRGFKKTVVPR